MQLQCVGDKCDLTRISTMRLHIRALLCISADVCVDMEDCDLCEWCLYLTSEPFFSFFFFEMRLGSQCLFGGGLFMDLQTKHWREGIQRMLLAKLGVGLFPETKLHYALLSQATAAAGPELQRVWGDGQLGAGELCWGGFE